MNDDYMISFQNETKQTIEASYKKMTAVERSVADFFIGNKDDMDFSSKNISRVLYVSEATLSRFSQKCGYKGYREFIFSYERDLKKYEGQEIEFVISEFNPRKRRVIGDRKQLLVAAKKEKQKELFEKIEAGMKVEGVVKNVTDFGAFIDLGGADGLLHISEMSWGRVENPKKVFNIGDKVTVLIKDIQGEKIALSLKFPEENPWLKAEEKYKVGSVVTGKVARMTDFGAFVELESGIDALLHVSQIAKEHIDKPSDVLSVGQEIEAKVVDFKKDDKKISLSMKALANEEENTEEYSM